MKKYFLLLVFVPAIVLAQNTIQKDYGNFDEIKVLNGISVKLVKGEEGKITITGEEADNVVVINRNGKLRIRMQTKKVFNGDKTQVTVQFNKIEVIDANENSYIISNDELNTNTLIIRTQEGAEVKAVINVDRLEVKAVSGGIVDARGRADVQDVIINSGGQYDAKELKSKQTTVVINAGGNAKIYATDFASAKVRAGGRIEIYGKPKQVDKDTFIGGNILLMN